MANRIDVSPTHGNLLRLQDKLEQIRDGYRLLDRKREVLIQELMNMIAEAEEIEQQARDQFRAAHEAIAQARMRLGADRLEWVSLSPSTKIEVEVQSRTVMGVRVPLVEVNIETVALPYGPGDTSAALDRARDEWLAVVRLLGQLTETTIAVWRLAMEMRKTQRQVNALESVLIPQHEEAVHYIEQVLEEEEREDIVRAKKVKSLHDQEAKS